MENNSISCLCRKKLCKKAVLGTGTWYMLQEDALAGALTEAAIKRPPGRVSVKQPQHFPCDLSACTCVSGIRTQYLLALSVHLSISQHWPGIGVLSPPLPRQTPGQRTYIDPWHSETNTTPARRERRTKEGRKKTSTPWPVQSAALPLACLDYAWPHAR